MKSILIAVAFTAALTPMSLWAADPDPKAVMADSEKRNEGWKDGRTEMEMLIRRSDGREVIRRVVTEALEGESGEDRSLLRFEEPADVRGTVFLTHSKPMASDDQWIYLPSLRRVKRISSRRKTGRFMGSEFTYEDLENFALEKNDYAYVGGGRCGDLEMDCHIIEVRPKDEYSGYEKTVVYLDKDELRTWKIDFYSKRTGKLSKTLSFHDFHKMHDRWWRPKRLVMVSSNGGETELRMQNEQLGIGLDERDFRRSALERRQ